MDKMTITIKKIVAKKNLIAAILESATVIVTIGAGYWR
jgi:hypothetical protein